MLHMIVSTHGPDTCPAVVPALAQKMTANNKRTNDVAKALGVTIQGTWTDMPSHTIFMLVDAPNAHVLGQMAMELHLIDWNKSRVYPVITMQEAITQLQKREAKKLVI